MEHPAALNQDFNLSADRGITIRSLAELIWRKASGGGPPRLAHDEPFEHDVQRRVPSTAKARRLLGFEATTTIDAMLDEVIPWVAGAIEAGTI
jgi:nucleoside-diphosphate-sugar epimerase